MTTRRKWLIALGAGALVAPFGAFAQQGKVWRVGFLYSGSRQGSVRLRLFDAFPRGMRELGYVEGKNLVIEWRFADDRLERLPDLAAELVRLKVDVIVTQALDRRSVAAQKATTTIPIVMATVGDPVDSGFVKSLARPGGNITGFSNLAGDISPKHLEMLLSHGAQALARGRTGESRQSGPSQDSEDRPGRGAEGRREGLAGGSADSQEIENAFSG